MRINQENTMIQNHQYPLQGYTPDEMKAFFSQKLRPYKLIIDQVQGAIFLYNIPLLCLIIFLGTAILYFIYAISQSNFPTILFLLALIPSAQLVCLEGGDFFKPMCIQLPDKPLNAPDRIRTIEEIVDICYVYLVFFWRAAFFIYRTLILPNVIDCIVLIIACVVIGLILCVVNIVAILAFLFYLAIFIPMIITRKPLYNFIMIHLGHPDDAKYD